jgi:hypothetical protein
VLYNVSTLYFETDTGSDAPGLPLMVEAFEGNKGEP